MADKKISAMTSAAALGGTEAIPAVQAAGNVKLTPQQLSTFIISSSAGAGTPAVALTGTVLGQLTTTSATFAEFDIQNTTAGATASTDMVVNADNATATTHYGNFGINSSVYTGSGSFNLAGATYLTATTGELVLGTTTANGIHFVVNNGATDAGSITSSGNVSFTNMYLGGYAPDSNVLGVTGTETHNFGTLTTAVDGITINGTWNNAGVTFPGAFLVNVTNTAGNSNSRLMDIQLGGTSQFYVKATGQAQSQSSLFAATNGIYAQNGGSIGVTANGIFGFSSGTGDASSGFDTFIGRQGAATIRLGSADVDTAPVAQTLRTQGALAGGTSNVAGVNWTDIVSPGKGTGVGGSRVIQTSPAGTTGTSVNAPVTRLTIDGPGNVVVGSAALATNVTDGFLYIPTCSGTPTGVPTSFTGRIAMIYDTTNHQFWFYDSGWKQPKTPAGAAIVTWQ